MTPKTRYTVRPSVPVAKSTPFIEGANACRLGVKLCPYRSNKRREWVRGWKAASADGAGD